MVPIPGGFNVSGVKSNGVTAAYYYKTVKGYQYIFFPAGTADYEVAFVADNTPPTVIGTLPPNGATGVSVGTNVTVAFSEAMDNSTIKRGQHHPAGCTKQRGAGRSSRTMSQALQPT